MNALPQINSNNKRTVQRKKTGVLILTCTVCSSQSIGATFGHHFHFCCANFTVLLDCKAKHMDCKRNTESGRACA